ncbi:MAG: VOC family protein [Kangiellaceae bacterium]|nr:VOC family protein [Kangiellaceae bacterium]
MISEMVTAIYVDDLVASKSFYCDLLELEVKFEADWIVQLSSAENKNINLTLQPRTNALIPKRFQTSPQGFSIAFVVPSCDDIFARAIKMGLEVISEPKNEEYGQRRFLTVDPDGALLDVSSNCEPSKEFIERYMS